MAQNSMTPAVPTPQPQITPYDPAAPIVHDLKLSKDAEEWFKTLSPGLFENYKAIEGTWNHPMTQFSITLVRDLEFRSAVTEMYSKHAMSAFYGYELSWILLVWILRAWRLSKSPTWLTRLGTQAWIAVLYWVVSILVVPSLVWGEAYRTVLSHLAKAIFKHFLA